MSLINDALKRAKEAQAKAPAPEGSIPHLRPVEASRSGLRGTGLLLPIVLTLVALGGLFFLWQGVPRNIQVRAANGVPAAGAATNPLEGGARSPLRAAAVAEPGKTLAAAPEQRRAGDSAPYPAVAAPAMPTAPANAAEVAAVAQTTSAPPVSASSGAATNLSSLPVPVVVKPAVPRLQAIVFNPARPWAMINGKTLLVGDRIGEFRVLAIDRQSATLVGASGTNVLTLPE
jgi:hypothetical protein